MLSSLNQMTSINSFKNPSLQLDNKIEENKPNSFSSNDSTHESNPKSRKYIFEKDTNSYEVYLILYEDKIKIKVNKLPENIEEYYYETTISQEELKKSNKVFKLCNDIEDSFDYLNELIGDKQNKVIVNEENEKFILEKKIKLYFPLKIEVEKKFKNNDIFFFLNTIFFFFSLFSCILFSISIFHIYFLNIFFSFGGFLCS